jgi:hypothetical protein
MDILHKVLSDVFIGVANMAAAAVAYYGGRALKRWAEKEDHTRLRRLAAEAVRWAAQKMQDSLGKEKYEAVADRIASKLPWVNEGDLEQAIEAAVHDLNAGVQAGGA